MDEGGGITIREFTPEDAMGVREICYSHFRSLTLPAVTHYLIQHGGDMFAFVVITFLFLNVYQALIISSLYVVYLFLRSRIEFELYIRNDCPDLEDIFRTYMTHPKSHFWVGELSADETKKSTRKHNPKYVEGASSNAVGTENSRLAFTPPVESNSTALSTDQVITKETHTEQPIQYSFQSDSSSNIVPEDTENTKARIEPREKSNRIGESLGVTSSTAEAYTKSDKAEEGALAANDASTYCEDKLADSNSMLSSSSSPNLREQARASVRSPSLSRINSLPGTSATKKLFYFFKRKQTSSSRKIVGCIGLAPYKEDPTIAHLVRLVVSLESRRMRIGSRLLKQLENFASEAGYRELRLYTNNLNPSALRFVRQSGFNLIQMFPRGLMRGDLITWQKNLLAPNTPGGRAAKVENYSSAILD
ncbi:acetyltransferase, GnaT family protein [Cardiosporidium cionae]|uniref:Acetyltransferase, GnaT family protein n=1 Tax=Cardiosporidium cionae TaxID=476202 RepID=A0ABQ7J9U0_9APIC|nr:acetyltransferase, GnaT family protein [Cardiosporidium cionae]|eukprot:KAF8820726.1 acetyltransferase, GnaT family protein [Cardiosporidium cionae]